MKKANFTKDQIETLLIDGQIAVSTNLAFNNPNKITSDLNKINNFLKVAFELHLIDDYNDVLKLQKQIGAAAMEEYEKLTKEGATA